MHSTQNGEWTAIAVSTIVKLYSNLHLARTFCEMCSNKHDSTCGSWRFCFTKSSRVVGRKARALKRNNPQSNKSSKPKTASSQLQSSVEKPLSWKSESIVLHKLKNPERASEAVGKPYMDIEIYRYTLYAIRAPEWSSKIPATGRRIGIDTEAVCAIHGGEPNQTMSEMII